MVNNFRLKTTLSLQKGGRNGKKKYKYTGNNSFVTSGEGYCINCGQKIKFIE